MAQLRINVTFNQGGAASVGIIPSDVEEWKPEQSDTLAVDLESGDYAVTWVTLTQGGGSIEILVDGERVHQADLPVGDGGDNVMITIP